MVFTKLSAQEKGAFFGLLDEYFQSRPELFGQGGGGGQGVSGLAGTGISTTVAASAVQRALASNSATGSNGRTGGGASGLGKSTNPFSAAGLATPSSGDVARAVTVGRVAAASLAFSQTQAHPGGASPSPSPSLFPSPAHVNADVHSSGPPSLPRRGMFDVPALAGVGQQSVMATPGSEVDKLVTRKTSMFSALKKQPAAGVTIPSAFVPSKSPFGPPPARRAASETSADDGSGAGASASTSTGTTQSLRVGLGTRATQWQPVATPPPPPEEQAEGVEGEWVQVLYDYGSEDPGDLAIEAGTRVLVTARSSEDWWTGQVEGQGKEGLFPASYVKLL